MTKLRPLSWLPELRLLGVLVATIALLGVACGGEDPTPAPTQPPASTTAPSEPATEPPAPSALDELIAAAKEEGELVVVTSGDSPIVNALAKAYTEKYGISVTQSILRTAEMEARLAAERGAGKSTVDLYSSGANRALDAKGQGRSLGDLPILAEEPDSRWIIDPRKDTSVGASNVVFYAVAPNYLLANNELCPPDNCPTSYKDLADPKWRDLDILMVEPIGITTGSFILGFLYEEYGEQFTRDVLLNVDSVLRGTVEGEKAVARGEFALFITGKAPRETFKLPAPRPLRPIRPADGLIASVSGWLNIVDSPNQNAAKLFVNFSLTQEGQQAMANELAGGFIRNDVVPVEPELALLEGNIFPGAPASPEFSVRYPDYVPVYEEVLKQTGLR
jgi:iron(III) transport system substrate-binding protein